jgi:hypothetical protein
MLYVTLAVQGCEGGDSANSSSTAATIQMLNASAAWTSLDNMRIQGNLTGVVNSLYLGLLGRAPESQAMGFYTNALNAGAFMTAVVDELTNTAEFAYDCHRDSDMN